MRHEAAFLAGLLVLGQLCGCNREVERRAVDAAGVAATGATERSRVLATVNGVPLTEEEVGFALLGGHGRRVTPELKRAALERLIEAELVYQRGLKLGLDRERRYRRAVRALELRLAALRRREMQRRVFDREVAAKVQVTDEDTRRYFEANASKIRRTYRLAVLRFRRLGEARAAHGRLQAGASFEALARELGPRAPAGGRPPWELEPMSWRQLPMEWVEAVCALRPGQVSGVVQGKQTGISIFKLLERRELRGVTFEALRGSLMNRLRDVKAAEAREQYLRRLRAGAKIVLSDR